MAYLNIDLLQVINYNHVMPTRYSVDISFDKTNLNKELLKVILFWHFEWCVALCALLPRVSVVMLVGIYLSLTSLGQSRRAGQILFSFLDWNGRGLIVMPACYSSMGTYRLCRAFNPTLSSAYRELALNSLPIYSRSLLRIPWRRRRPGTWWGPNLRSATRAARTGRSSAWWFERWWEF